MSQAVVGALRVSLGLDSAQFTNGLSAAQRQLQGVGQRMQQVGARIATVGAGMTAAITLPALAMGRALMDGATSAAAAAGQVNAALTSMGHGAGRSFEQLAAQAERLSATSLFDDDDIMVKVTANLLTFGNVAEDSFDRAQQAAVNLSARMGGDLQASALMIGKALNAPTQGLAALRRVGIQFTADQEAMIKAMDAAGNSAGAQAIMLGELERQFGGAAQAARDADPMRAAMIDLGRSMGVLEQHFVPVIAGLGQFISKLADGLSALTPFQAKMALIGVAVAAAVGPALVAIGAVVSAVGVLVPIVGAISLPFLAVAAAVAAVGVAFWVFRDDIIPILQSFAASLQENLGPKIEPLWEAIKSAAAAVGDVFMAIFGDGSPGSAAETIKVFGEVIARIFGAAVDVITGAINVITNIMRALGALLRGDFSAMWGYLGQAVMAAVRGIANAFQTLFPEVVSWVRQTYEGVKDWLLDRFAAVVRGIVEKITQVKDAFFNLYDAVVGNSYIPDLVEEIADWMGPRLQDAMVDPALSAIDETASAFGSMATDVSNEMEGLFRSIGSKDWKGVLGGVLDIFGKAGGDSIWGKLGRVGSSLLGGKIPGFKTGGSFKVGGSGGADSQLMQFRATPGEMVDIRRPGQDAGGGMVVHVNPSPYFDVQVERVAAPMAVQAAATAYGATRSDMATAQRRSRQRFV
jgi:hypothetical protein